MDRPALINNFGVCPVCTLYFCTDSECRKTIRLRETWRQTAKRYRANRATRIEVERRYRANHKDAINARKRATRRPRTEEENARRRELYRAKRDSAPTISVGD